MLGWDAALVVVLLSTTADPTSRWVAPAFIATWVGLILGIVSSYQNAKRVRRETQQEVDERTRVIIRDFVGDREFMDKHDERVSWITHKAVDEAFAERASSFVSRDRYDERIGAINERFATTDKQLAEINTKLDKMPEMMRREIAFVMSQYIVVPRGKDPDFHD